jgi:hypothetical protein
MFTNKDTKFFKEDEAIGLTEKLLIKADKGREISGIPWIITSGFRTVEKNKKVGGVENSAHLKGEAIDVLAKDDHTRFLIIKGAIMAGFNRIEIAPFHIHLDIDETKDQEIAFFPK